MGNGQHKGLRKEIARDGDCADAVHGSLGPTNDHDIRPLRVYSSLRDVARACDQTKTGDVARRVDALLAQLLVVDGDDDAEFANSGISVVGGRTTTCTASPPEREWPLRPSR